MEEQRINYNWSRGIQQQPITNTPPPQYNTPLTQEQLENAVEMTPDGVKPINVQEVLKKNTKTEKPTYYDFEIEGFRFDVFDLLRAARKNKDLSIEMQFAIKYLLRDKDDNQLDVKKAITCLEKHLENEGKNYG